MQPCWPKDHPNCPVLDSFDSVLTFSYQSFLKQSSERQFPGPAVIELSDAFLVVVTEVLVLEIFRIVVDVLFRFRFDPVSVRRIRDVQDRLLGHLIGYKQQW